MKIYTYSQARNRLSDILEESKTEEIVIKRRRGDMFIITPVSGRSVSPFDVPPTGKNISRRDILAAIRESRER